MTKNANQFQQKKPVKIGITGQNQTDGMGDIVHILNVGQALSREGVADVTYHIDFSMIPDIEENDIIGEKGKDLEELLQERDNRFKKKY